MAKKQNSFKNFIKKIESIDIQDLFEKAQSINVEDIRNFEWKKFYNSNLFFISIGILSAIISTSYFLIPSIKKSNALRFQSNLFQNQSRQLEQLKRRTNESFSLRDKIEFHKNEISRLLIDKNSLILIPRILDEAAKRSNISLIEIKPIQRNDIFCFYSDENRLNIKRELNQEKNRPKNINYKMNSGAKDANQLIDFKKSKVSNKKLNNLFTKESNQISKKFNSNFYQLTLNGYYLDSLTFMKLIQEYNVIIYPVCFEPKSRFSTNVLNRESKLIRPKNTLNIKLIINVPTN